uniref:Protein salvador homolog 1 n=1 Tax=Mesocestoides corti TaxID=53468 RepID=A0A5K3EVM5_MESCO
MRRRVTSKRFIEETCAEMRVPERIYKVVFEDDDRPRQKMAASNTKTILSEDRRPSSMEILGSPTPPPKPSTSVHRTFFQENVNSKSCVQSDMQPQQKTLSAVQISFDQTDRKSAKVEPLSALLESAQTPEKNHLPFGNLTDEQQNLTYPRIRVRKPANQTEIPKLPWYYRKLSQPNLWLQRSSDNNNVARCSSATFGVDMSTTPSPSLEEPTPLTPVEEHIYRTSLSQNVEEIPPIQIRSSTEDAKWENTDSLRKFLDVSGRSRAADKHPPVIQTRNSVESPRPNCFPPLQLLTQLRQQEFESVKAWLSRTESQLWLYLKPTCREYEVILRWLLSCGRRGGESVTASTSLTLNELLLQLTERDDCPTNKSVTSVLYENTN